MIWDIIKTAIVVVVILALWVIIPFLIITVTTAVIAFVVYKVLSEHRKYLKDHPDAR